MSENRANYQLGADVSHLVRQGQHRRTVVLSLRVTPDVLAALEISAQTHGMTPSSVAARILERELLVPDTSVTGSETREG